MAKSRRRGSKGPRLQSVRSQDLHDRILQLARVVAEQDQTIEVLAGAVQELTLQTQFILRTITRTEEVVGLLDVKPRKVTARLLDLYRKRKAALIQELEHEQQTINEARARDEQRLRDAITAAGVDVNNEVELAEYFRQVETGERPNPFPEEGATSASEESERPSAAVESNV
jgi:hypothetical protein